MPVLKRFLNKAAGLDKMFENILNSAINGAIVGGFVGGVAYIVSYLWRRLKGKQNDK